MREISLTKTIHQANSLNRWYQSFEKKLSFPVRTERIETRFGYTEVMISGPSSGPPLVLLHGAMAGAPFALGELGNIPTEQPTFAVNIPGQSIRAAEVELAFDGVEYGQWLMDVFRALNLEKPILAGVSWGGGVALQLAQYAPEAISGLILVVPSGLVLGPIWRSLKLAGFPLLRYQLFPSNKNRDAAFRHILTTPDEFWVPYLAEALTSFRAPKKLPKSVKREQLHTFLKPTFVIGAENDIYFPGEMVIDKARQVFRNLVGTQIIPGANHCPSFSHEGRAEFQAIFRKAMDSAIAKTTKMEVARAG